jgi:hypothetical protein
LRKGSLPKQKSLDGVEENKGNIFVLGRDDLEKMLGASAFYLLDFLHIYCSFLYDPMEGETPERKELLEKLRNDLMTKQQKG